MKMPKKQAKAAYKTGKGKKAGKSATKSPLVELGKITKKPKTAVKKYRKK